MVKSVTNSSLTANGSQLCMDYHDGKYGINTDPNRGADTFIPFHSGDNVKAICLYQIGQDKTKNLFTATEEMNGFYLYTLDNRQKTMHLYKNNVEIDYSNIKIIGTLPGQLSTAGFVYVSVPIAINDVISYKPGGGGGAHGLVLSGDISCDGIGII